MRVLLFTGKGGAGTTTLAAATAVFCAARGRRTLLLSLGPAHALGDVLEHPVGPALSPVPLEGEATALLWAQEIDAFAEAERSWGPLEGWLRGALARVAGVRLPPTLAALPGAEAVAGLLVLLAHEESRRFDVAVVDAPPIAATLRLLGAADALHQLGAGAWPDLRGDAGWARSLLSRLLNLPDPEDSVVGFVQGVVNRLQRVRATLTNPERTSVRVVLPPGRAREATYRSALSGFSLFELPVDAIICNRAIERATSLEDQDSDLAVLSAPLQGSEPTGTGSLARLADQTYGDRAPDAPLSSRRAGMHVARENGELALYLPLPGAVRQDLRLSQVGGAITLRVGQVQRTLILPPCLAGRTCTGARLAEGRLRLRFV